MDLILGIAMIAMGVSALNKGEVRLSKNRVCRKNTGLIGLILIAALPLGAALSIGLAVSSGGRNLDQTVLATWGTYGAAVILAVALAMAGAEDG